MKTKTWIIIGIIALALVAWGLTKLSTSSPQTSNNNQNSHEITIPNKISESLKLNETDHIKGDPESKITLIEYSDFQCPACKSYFPMLEQLNEDLGDSIAFAYRHFPLKSIHKNAELAAQASVAASLQGKFWEMHDELFDNQIKWANQKNKKARETFISYAKDLQLDTEKFTTDLNSDIVKNKVRSDMESALANRVNSTPSFFINGTKIQNPRSTEELKTLIEQIRQIINKESNTDKETDTDAETQNTPVE